jgi:hypothetical protein
MRVDDTSGRAMQYFHARHVRERGLMTPTLGPWKISKIGNETWLIGPAEQEVAKVLPSQMHEDDVYLMRAAPEMLEALRLVQASPGTLSPKVRAAVESALNAASRES